MKRFLSGLLALILIFSLTACTAPEAPSPEESGIKTDPKAVSELPGSWDFAHKLLLTSAGKGENILLSPLSVAMTLAMAANGAEGETLKQMEDLFCDGMSIGEWNGALTEYLEPLTSKRYSSTLSIANSVLAREGSAVLSEEFVRRVQETYGAEVSHSPFDGETLKEVNEWVSYHTDGMIPVLLEEFDPETAVLLLNALLLEVCWQDPYVESEISDGIFTAADGRRQEAKMMTSVEGTFLEWDGATGTVLALADGYSLLVILPEEGTSPEDALAKLSAGDLQKELREDYLTAKVTVKIPQFSMEYSAEMRQILEKLGMGQAFDGKRAQFGPMGTCVNGSLYLNRVVHKAALELDDKGVKAAAVTAAHMNALSYDPGQPEHREVILDRPFAFYLLGTGDVPVFAGIVNEME